MNIEKIFSPLIAVVIALLIYQSYNIYAENEPVEGGVEETAPLPPVEGTAPLPPAEATAPLLPAEGTAPPLIEIPVPVHPPKEEMFWLSPPSERKKEYVGMEKCRICHTTQYDKWNETLHAKWQPSFTTPEKKQKARMECE